ncbi:MAG: arginine--tRNA ligase [Planctomycetes bacterium]|nr:arginine--tRNA ligase [Planctomycetota bacterium]MBI3843680.1 arginine--tRNA ligase [Planctomycetota bacterium]
MSAFSEIRAEVATALASASGLPVSEVDGLLTWPPPGVAADFAFPCFTLAKTLRKAPPAIATEIAAKITSGGIVVSAAALGGYVNVRTDPGKQSARVIAQALREGDRYGMSTEGAAKTIVIDYSSPNIAKPFSIAHLRSTVIGRALVNVYRALGYTVVGVNHLGDWGTQFGKLITAFKAWGDEKQLEERPIRYLLELYVKFHAEVKSKPELDDDARRWFKRLEDGDADARALWQRFRDLSLTEFNRVYDMLGVTFDRFSGEAFYNDRLDATVARVEAKGLATRSQDALVVDLEPYGMPPCLLRKADDATLYATRDLAAAYYRHEQFQFHKNLYVVGSDQTLHFRQLFKVLELLGEPWAASCVHVPFGLIQFKDGKMSTREGKVVFLEEVLAKAVELAADIIREKNPELASRGDVAKAVGIGAVVFNDLKNRRIKDVLFDWNELLNFDGKTGPYLQYTHARAASILRKAGALSSTPPYERLVEPEESAVVKLVGQFPDRIRAAADEYEPSMVSQHLLDLAEAFNTYYNHHRILLDDDAPLREARLALTASVKQVLKNGLSLLGVVALEEM